MTDIELLKNSVDVLGAINVPVGLLESIGVPIYQVRKNLVKLLEAVAANSKKADEEQPGEEPEVAEPTEE